MSVVVFCQVGLQAIGYCSVLIELLNKACCRLSTAYDIYKHINETYFKQTAKIHSKHHLHSNYDTNQIESDRQLFNYFHIIQLLFVLSELGY